MNKRTLLALTLPVALLASPVLAGGELGDPAPALKVAEWVKGDKVDLEAGKGKNIYVVEFWATWCGPCRTSIPHLTEMAEKYEKKNVTFIGVSAETTNEVKPFVEKMGDKMNYVVACDDNRETSKGYMEAFGIGGIPHAFIVDKESRIVWHGHPMDGLDETLEKVVAGTYDLTAAKKAAEEARMAAEKDAKLREQLNGYMMMCMNGTDDEEAFNKAGKEALETIGDNIRWLNIVANAMISEARFQKRDLDLAYAAIEKSMKLTSGKYETEHLQVLNSIAWNMLTAAHLETRNLPLARKVAKAAYDCCEGKDGAIVDTYARALWDTGDKVEALKLQRTAVEICEEPQMKAELQKTLDNYEKEMSENH